jgi:hypothetical protein
VAVWQKVDSKNDGERSRRCHLRDPFACGEGSGAMELPDRELRPVEGILARGSL